MQQEQKPQLLLGFRIGATHSRISYRYFLLNLLEPPKFQVVFLAFLNQGKVQRYEVRFPGQPAPGNSTIPSVIYYSRDGQVRAVGSDVGREWTEALARNEDWVKAERFVLHFQSRIPRPNLLPLPPLPLRKTAVEVLSDFLVYLNNSAKWYLQEFLPAGSGRISWDGVSIHYILSHPNGWEGPEHVLMREAVEAASLIPDKGQNQLTFVPEGEACLDFSIKAQLTNPTLRSGVIVVAINNETVDISSYTSCPDQTTFLETTEPQCHAKGSSFVTQAAQEHLYGLLKDSRFHSDIPEMVQYFDRAIKPNFGHLRETYYIPLSSTHDTNARLHIKEGKFCLNGEDIATFFQPLIKRIVLGVLTQRRTTRRPLHSVVLLGDLASNNYVFRQVQNELEPHYVGVKRPYASAEIDRVIAEGIVGSVLRRYQDPLARGNSGTGTQVSNHPEMPWVNKNLRAPDAEDIPLLRNRISQLERQNSELQRQITSLKADYTNRMEKQDYAIQELREETRDILQNLQDGMMKDAADWDLSEFKLGKGEDRNVQIPLPGWLKAFSKAFKSLRGSRSRSTKATKLS